METYYSNIYREHTALNDLNLHLTLYSGQRRIWHHWCVNTRNTCSCPSGSSATFCPAALREKTLRGKLVEATSAWPRLAGSLYPKNAAPTVARAFSLWTPLECNPLLFYLSKNLCWRNGAGNLDWACFGCLCAKGTWRKSDGSDFVIEWGNCSEGAPPTPLKTILQAWKIKEKFILSQAFSDEENRSSLLLVGSMELVTNMWEIEVNEVLRFYFPGYFFVLA